MTGQLDRGPQIFFRIIWSNISRVKGQRPLSQETGLIQELCFRLNSRSGSAGSGPRSWHRGYRYAALQCFFAWVFLTPVTFYRQPAPDWCPRHRCWSAGKRQSRSGSWAGPQSWHQDCAGTRCGLPHWHPGAPLQGVDQEVLRSELIPDFPQHWLLQTRIQYSSEESIVSTVEKTL